MEPPRVPTNPDGDEDVSEVMGEGNEVNMVLRGWLRAGIDKGALMKSGIEAGCVGALVWRW